MESVQRDLFGNEVKKPDLVLNLYADETMNRKCPYQGHNWHYICIIFERSDKSLLEDLIRERYCKNLDKSSDYYEKNNKILHWKDLTSNDEKNICKRWFQYIMNTQISRNKFYCYILGLNESFLNDEEFDPNDKFGSIYNRFFRTAVEYGIKTFFPQQKYNKIIIKKIYHEQGPQEHHKYFKWHPIDRLSEKTNFTFDTKEIQFLSKDHNSNERSNILQLCDCFLGASVHIIHGLDNPKSRRSKLKDELLSIICNTIKDLVYPDDENTKNANQYHILFRFFPKEKTKREDTNRTLNQFFNKRRLKYFEDKFGGGDLFQNLDK